MMQTGNPVLDIAMLAILVMSVVLHEVAHGYVAYRLGDWTAKLDGRLTLNPLAHIDPVGTILLPLLLFLLHAPIFGWAKPVPVNWYNLRGGERAIFLVSVAGIAVNITIALICSLLLRLFGSSLINISLLAYALYWAVAINLLLALFNLIPIPPLDGSRLLRTVLPRQYQMQMDMLEPYGLFIIFAVVALFGAQLSMAVSSLLRLLTGI